MRRGWEEKSTVLKAAADDLKHLMYATSPVKHGGDV